MAEYRIENEDDSLDISILEVGDEVFIYGSKYEIVAVYERRVYLSVVSDDEDGDDDGDLPIVIAKVITKQPEDMDYCVIRDGELGESGETPEEVLQKELRSMFTE
jgi:hypothetical protein